MSDFCQFYDLKTVVFCFIACSAVNMSNLCQFYDLITVVLSFNACIAVNILSVL